jgi:peroxiredoxin
MGLEYKASSAVLAALLLCAGPAQGDQDVEKAGNLHFGDPAPKATERMRNIDGRALSISDTQGPKGTLVLFSCNACPWVKAWEDRIAAIGNAYRKRGIGVIAINANDPEVVPEDGYKQMVERAQEKGLEFPYVVDASSDVAAAFGATRTPEAFLFDGEGRLIYHGAIDDNARNPDQVEDHYLKDALDALIAGESIQRRSTKALGCSIKFRRKS